MSIDHGAIGVKVMLIAPNAERTAHAVSLNPATRENPDGYHRLVGGSVEFGETHRDAIVREVREELDAAVHELELLEVVESLFEIDGERGHEVVFVSAGRLDPMPAVAGASLTESDGQVMPVVWRPVHDAAERIPLYPAAVAPLIRRLAPAG